jgi:membrane protein YqaA with SNARE-associated domain
MRPESHPLHGRVTAFCLSAKAAWFAFLWGLAEATLFFLVPDILLGFLALFNWRRALLATSLTVAGALVGGAIMFGLGANDPQAMDRVLTSIPLIDQEMVDSVDDATGSTGVSALTRGPLQGIPYKIYAVQAGRHGLPIYLFLLVTIVARLMRFLPVVLASAAAGSIFREFIRRHTGLVIGGYLLFWLGVYTWYFFQFQ